MYIKNIRLTNFRNYGRIDLDVGPSVNIIYGNNAQGKTNLIEAINVCSCISSHRTSKDRDLIKFGEKEYITELLLHDDEYDTDTSISASFYTEESEDNPNSTAKRELKHDGMAVDKISDYMGKICCIVILPKCVYFDTDPLQDVGVFLYRGYRCVTHIIRNDG